MAPRILHKSKQTTLERADLGHNWLAAGADDGEKASKKAAKISKIEPKMEIHYSRIIAAIYFHFFLPTNNWLSRHWEGLTNVVCGGYREGLEN